MDVRSRKVSIYAPHDGIKSPVAANYVDGVIERGNLGSVIGSGVGDLHGDYRQIGDDR